MKKRESHGLSSHPLYNVWGHMRRRIKNPSGKNACYAGISVCDEWENSFKSFYDWAIGAGYAPGKSIDREDRSGNYNPGNCRWTDDVVQSQNRSKTSKKSLPKGVYYSAPRAGKKLYGNTGNTPYYWIVIYKGKRHQKWGFATPEDAQRDRASFIKQNYDGLVYPN